MGTQPTTGGRARRQYRGVLLNWSLVLAVVSAILHLYIGLVVYGVPLGIPLVLIALVYLGGTGMIIADYRRSLWLKVGLAWVALVLVLWAATAAVNAPHTRDPLAYLDKAVEVVLLGLLFLLRRQVS